MTKFKLEYIWLDGCKPTPNLRGKTLIKEFDAFPTLGQLPNWGFDGSSTEQAEGKSSDCVLKPVALYPDATRQNGFIVLSEVMMPDGTTPHPSNARATIAEDPYVERGQVGVPDRDGDVVLVDANGKQWLGLDVQQASTPRA